MDKCWPSVWPVRSKPPGAARGKLNLPIAKSVISAVVNGRIFELEIPDQPKLKIMLRLDGSFEVVAPA
jgi:hypothetical protein